MLERTTTVTKDKGAERAGIYTDDTTLTLLDTTTIHHNTASVDRGGTATTTAR